jgi:hypothetical protein
VRRFSRTEMFKEEIQNYAIAHENHLDKIRMTHRLMDGNLLYNINKSIKDDKIDYVVMGTEGASGWSEFLGTHTGNVFGRCRRSDTLYSNRCKIQENGNHRFYDTL